MSEDVKTTYEKLMGIPEGDADGGGAAALGKRLVAFREWVSKDANIDVNNGVCIVNGEATDGTKNAPVLVFGPPPGAQPIAKDASSGRTGIVDGDADRALYERTMGCQIRTSKELKKDAVVVTVPRSAMVTPDVVAASDAGRSISACCQAINKPEGEASFWDAFENTTLCEEKFKQKLARNTGTQLLVKILQERKRAENAFNKATKELENGGEKAYKLVSPSEISSRAPFLAFLIHQRFSPTANPPVVSSEAETLFEGIKQKDGGSSAISNAKRITLQEGSPSTFAPYARVLPSSVSLPICWKRNEIALLAGCIPGVTPLLEIAAQTMQLTHEFIALLEAGILSKFPGIFPSGLITWERWVWAAAVFSSRTLPSTCYLNEGDKSAASHVGVNGEVLMQSPREIFDELGVMIPLLDMCNHELDANQITWQPCVPEKKNDEAMEDAEVETVSNPHPPRAIAHKRIKKGEQLYINYGPELSNQSLMLSYGFAQMSNKCDEVRLGWGLMDAVGNIPVPNDYVAPFKVENEKFAKYNVYESMEPNAVNEWWSDARLEMLEQEAFAALDDSFMSSLKMGKKMMGAAHSDGHYHPILLTAALIGTIPPPELAHHISKKKADSRASLVVTIRHQHALRDYLIFVYSRKMEKLLENLNNGLKDHFGALQLWTKASDNGLRYKPSEDESDEPKPIGWQTFFDEHAYSATMEVEGRYYAMGPDSCVLTLYDGQLQALQASLDGLSTWEKYAGGVLQQLKDLGFTIGTEGDAVPDSVVAEGSESSKRRNQSDNKGKQQAGDKNKSDESKDGKKDSKDGKSPSKSSRRRNRKRNSGNGQSTDRPPAIKLHIGNLSYQTTPGDLFEYFARMHGRESILECHIPTERETGKSRGFGFVTLPERVAREILAAGRKHEVHGRVLKVAESNSAGSNRPNRGPAMPPPPGDARCVTCGYRPKYCVCPAPNIPGGGSREHEYYRGEYDYSRPRSRGDRYSRSPSPYHRSRRDYDDYEYDRDYRRDRYYDRDRSRSPSYGRGRDRDRDRRRRSPERDRSRERSPGRSSRDRSRERGRSRDSRGRRGGSGRDWDRRSSRGSPRRSRSKSRSRSPSYSRRDRKPPPGGPEKDRSASPSPGESPRNRESRKRSSRSRSRGRSSKKSKKRRRHRSRSRSRSRSASPADVDNK